jgi:AraC-like DNA-binding protein
VHHHDPRNELPFPTRRRDRSAKRGAVIHRYLYGPLRNVQLSRRVQDDYAGPETEDDEQGDSFLDCAGRDLMVRLYRELRAPDACSAAVIDGLSLALLGVAARADSGAHRGTAPAWLARAEEYLRAHAYGRVRAADAAAAAGVHPVLLSRWFRRVHGMTVGEFVRHLRVERASQLLATTRQSITHVALACGFVDHAHLSRIFRRTMQLTPSAYRGLRSGS